MRRRSRIHRMTCLLLFLSYKNLRFFDQSYSTFSTYLNPHIIYCHSSWAKIMENTLCGFANTGPSATAINDEHKSYSYGDLIARADVLACELQERDDSTSILPSIILLFVMNHRYLFGSDMIEVLILGSAYFIKRHSFTVFRPFLDTFSGPHFRGYSLSSNNSFNNSFKRAFVLWSYLPHDDPLFGNNTMETSCLLRSD
jgi:hypothetical protein